MLRLINYIKTKTIDKLDKKLFVERKWSFVRIWMLNPIIYNLLKLLRFREGEHQIGRLRNQKKIFNLIYKNRLKGDIIEFGSHQGFGLLWLTRFRDYFELSDTKIIGIDSFEGLPESSTIWVKGQFNDTSEELCENNLKKYLDIDSIAVKNIYLIKGLFNDKEVEHVIKRISSSLLLAHVDCDLGSSCDSALTLIDKLNKEEKFYLLFDDWYLNENEIPKSFGRFEIIKNNTLKFSFLLRTRFTKYYSAIKIKDKKND